MTWPCTRDWVCARCRELRVFAEWLAPTKKQVIGFLWLLFVLFLLSGIGESNRKNRVIRATTLQLDTVTERLKSEIDGAQVVHGEMLQRIESLEQRVRDLEEK